MWSIQIILFYPPTWWKCIPNAIWNDNNDSISTISSSQYFPILAFYKRQIPAVTHKNVACKESVWNQSYGITRKNVLSGEQKIGVVARQLYFLKGPSSTLYLIVYSCIILPHERLNVLVFLEPEHENPMDEQNAGEGVLTEEEYKKFVDHSISDGQNQPKQQKRPILHEKCH